MNDECRPPEGTEDKAVCWLYLDATGYLAWQWIGPHWHNGTAFPMAGDAYQYGCRFHSIVQPPEDAK